MAKAKASIVDQLSHKSTTNFRIESAGDDTIHIDQLVGNTEVYDTYDKLKDLFSAQAAGTPAGNKLNVKGTIKDGDSLTIGGKTYTFSKDGTGTNDKVNYVKVGANSAESLTNLQTALKDNGVKADVTADSITVYGEKVAGGGLTLQIGDTAADFNKMTVAVNDMSASGLGIDGLNIKTANSASDAIDTIKTAINTVSSTRAGMGALQNRLEYTINNLDVAVENLSAANSRIRDTDMAKEMMNYTKMNVLVQSAQAMLAQANQQPQSVLQLLQ
ncbi:MAG: hypothetical protein HFE43_08085 [Oscillospiraceae bacterium]|nr:hypothetical protein [Oscillospiraceae bacterium]